jgi:hypothetical protein
MIATSVALVIGIMLAPFISRLVRPGYVIAIGLAVAVVGLSILTAPPPGSCWRWPVPSSPTWASARS